MVPFNLKVASAQIAPKKLKKIFTTARMLGFSLNSLMLQTFPVGQNWETLGNMQACAMKPMNVSGKMLPR